MLSRGYLNDISLYWIGHEKQPILNLQTAGLKSDRWKQHCQPCHCLSKVWNSSCWFTRQTTDRECQSCLWSGGHVVTACSEARKASGDVISPGSSWCPGRPSRYNAASMKSTTNAQHGIFSCNNYGQSFSSAHGQKSGTGLEKSHSDPSRGWSRLSVGGVPESFTFTRIRVRIISARLGLPRACGCKRVCQKC